MRIPRVFATCALVLAALASFTPGQGAPRAYSYDALGNRTGATNQITFTSADALEISPRRASPGETVNIYGRNFPAGSAAGVSVTLGGISATIVSVGSRVLTIQVPQGVTSGAIVLNLPGVAPIQAGSLLVQSLVMSPARVGLDHGETTTFALAAVGLSLTSVTWTVNGIAGGNVQVGTISPTGVYTAPAATTTQDFPFVIAAQDSGAGVTAYGVVTTKCTNSSTIADEVFATGSLVPPNKRNCHTFQAQAGDTVYVAYVGTVPCDSISVRGSNNIALGSSGPGTIRRIPNILIPETGTYTIEVEAGSSQSGGYQLWMNRSSTPFAKGRWLYPLSESWHEPLNWAQGVLPTVNDPVIVGDFPANLTITVSQGSQTCATLTSAERIALTGGTLTVPGAVQVSNLFTLNGGTLALATVHALPPYQGPTVASNSNNRLSGVSILGDLNLTQSSAVTRIANGLSVSGAVRMSGANASLGFEGSQAFSSGEIVFEGTSNAYLEMVGPGTLTVGPAARISGGKGFIGGSWWFGGAMTLVNQGVIVADLPGEILTVGSTNTNWTSPGTLAATGGTLNLAGTLRTTGFGTLAGASGSVNVIGTINNTNANFSLDPTTGDLRLNGGTILGGIVNAATGSAIRVASNTQNRLSGLTVNGEILLSEASSVVRLQNGLTLNGAIRLSGANASLGFEGSQTFPSGEIVFEGTTSKIIEMVNAATLTIGPAATIRGGSGTIGGSWFFGAAMTLVNQGTITADVGGQSLTVGGTNTNWTSPGTLSAQAGNLNLGGTLTSAGLGTLASTGGTLNLTGTLNNTGATLVLDSTSGSLRLNGGTLLGGTVTATQGASLIALSNSSNRLNGVTLGGDLDLTLPGAVVRVQNGLSTTGVVHLGGTNASLAFEGSQTFSGGTIAFEGTNAKVIEMVGAGSLTLSPSVVIRGSAGTIGGSWFFGGAMTLVNQGTILADVAGQNLTVGTTSTAWTSPGTLRANGGNLVLSGTMTTSNLGLIDGANGTVTLTGTMINTGSTLVFNGTTGSLRMNGGTINGGTIDVSQGVTLTMLSNSANRLVGVRVLGDLSLSQSSSVVRIQNGLTISGNIRLSGANASLAFEGSQVFSGGNILFEGTASKVIEMVGAGTLTIAASASIRGSAGTIGGSWFFGGAMTLINQGKIIADVPGQSLTIGTSSTLWTSPGTLEADGGTLVFGGSLSTAGLGKVFGSRGVITLNGTVNNAGSTFAVNGTTGAIRMSGATIVGGTLDLLEDISLSIQSNSNNRLNGVTVNGDLLLQVTSSILRIQNGLTINGAVRMSGNASSLAFEGSQTFSSGTISFEGSGTKTIEMVSAGTLTLGPGAIVRGGGGTIGGSQAFGAAMTLINQGTILADVPTQSLTIGLAPTNWTSPGTLVANGGSLVLSGTLTTTGLGPVNGQNGTITLSGTVANAGSTFVVNGTTGSLRLNGGTIQGGTLDLSQGISLTVLSNSSNRLNGVTVNGDLLLSQNSSILRVQNGLTMNGAVRLSGSAASLAFEGSQTFANGSIIFEGTNSKFIEMVSAGTLTLGPGAVIRGGAGTIGGSQFFGGVMTLINQGTINADVAGQSLTIGNPSTLWTSPGTLVANGGNLNFGGTLTTTGLGVVNGQSGTITMTGTVNNTGSTLLVNGTTGSLRLNGGTILGGTLDVSQGVTLTVLNNSNNRLNGVSVQGDLLLSQSSSVVRIQNGLTINGAVRLSGAFSSLAFEGSQTFAGGSIIFEGTTTKVIEMVSAGTLTLGPSAVVRGGGGTIGGSQVFGGVMTLVNQGTINADSAGQNLTVGLSNTTWSSPGSLQANGGNLVLSGTLSASGLGVLNAPSGTITLSGTINNTGSTITATGGTASVRMSGGIINGGTVDVTQIQSLECLASTTNRVNGVTLNGGLQLSASSAVVRIQNGLALNGTIRLSGSSSSLAFEGSQSLNSGTIEFLGPNFKVIEMVSAGTLTIGSATTIRGGRGTIGGSSYFGGALTLINQGTITSDTAGETMTLQVSGLTNTGLLRAQNGGGLTVNGAPNVGGQIEVGSGSAVQWNSGLTLASNGVLRLLGGTFTANSGLTVLGTAEGAGTVVAPVTNSGLVAPGSPTGVLVITGTFAQTASGTLDLDVGGTTVGTGFDRLAVSGAASLNGTLALGLVSGFQPTLGQTFDVMTYPSRTGSFATVTGTDFGNGLGFQASLGTTALTLTVVTIP